MNKNKSLLYLQIFFVLGLLFVSQFNITKQLEEFFQESFITPPYRNGYFINYLLIYLWIGDLFTLGIITTGFLRKQCQNLSKSQYQLLFFILAYFAFHLSIFHEFVNIWYVVRVLTMLTSTFLIINLSKELKLSHPNVLSLITKLAICITAISISFQTLTAYFQTKAGTSIGLKFLGESQVVQGMINSSFIEINNSYLLRGYGTFPHPNLLGGYLLIWVIILLISYNRIEHHQTKASHIFLRFKDTRVKVTLFSLKILLLLFIAIAGIGVYLTYSRITLILYILIVSIYFLSLLYKRVIKTQETRKARVLIAYPFIVRFTSILSGNDLSAKERFLLFHESLKMLKENPMGVGWQNFTSEISQSPPRNPGGIGLLQPVHNSFLLLLNENGVIGGGVILTCLVFLISISFIKSHEKVLTALIIITITSIAFWDHYLITLPQGNILLLISAVLLYWLTLPQTTDRTTANRLRTANSARNGKIE